MTDSKNNSSYLTVILKLSYYDCIAGTVYLCVFMNAKKKIIAGKENIVLSFYLIFKKTVIEIKLVNNG